MELNVSTTKGYLIAAGLRGPDLESGFMGADCPIGFSLKLLFSTRLRFMCQVDYIGASLRESRYTSFDVEEFFAFSTNNPGDTGILHYLNHMDRAFAHLRGDETWGEEARLLSSLAHCLFDRLAVVSEPDCELKARRIIEKLNGWEADDGSVDG